MSLFVARKVGTHARNPLPTPTEALARSKSFKQEGTEVWLLVGTVKHRTATHEELVEGQRYPTRGGGEALILTTDNGDDNYPVEAAFYNADGDYQTASSCTASGRYWAEDDGPETGNDIILKELKDAPPVPYLAPTPDLVDLLRAEGLDVS